jgi:hypothetical protein
MANRLLRYARHDLAPLHRNPEHGFAADHALVAYPSGAVCSFIPKNACSSLRVSLAIANGCIAGPEDWTWIHHNNMTFRASLRDLATAPFTFVLLRCPHARLASVFLDKIVGLRHELWFLHRATREGFDPETFTFHDFVTLLEEPELLELDIHWRPQTAFLVYEEYDLWVPMEDLRAHLPAIESGAGLTWVDARGLTGHGTDRVETLPGVFSDMPVHELAALRRAGQGPAHAGLYDDDLAARVARLYSGDGRLYRARFGPEGLLFPNTFEDMHS